MKGRGAMTSDETTMNEQKRDRLAKAVAGIVADANVDPGTAVDVFIILTAATMASVEQLSLSDIDRLAEKGARKIADLARHFRKGKGEFFQ
jgi:hypothetical protein